MEKNKLKEIAKKYQIELENYNKEPFGTCYLAGPCIAGYLQGIGVKAREVTGNLLILDKHGKYTVYGRNKFKGKNVGEFHTWCEAEIDGKIYIIDASLKYNKIFLKEHFKIKANSNIPDILVTESQNTYYWKYFEEEELKPKSKTFYDEVSSSVIQKLTELN